MPKRHPVLDVWDFPEVLIIASSFAVPFYGCIVQHVTSVCNLGVVFDSELSVSIIGAESNIHKKASFFFCHLWNTARRSWGKQGLIYAISPSCPDQCNALFTGLPDCLFYISTTCLEFYSSKAPWFQMYIEHYISVQVYTILLMKVQIDFPSQGCPWHYPFGILENCCFNTPCSYRLPAVNDYRFLEVWEAAYYDQALATIYPPMFRGTEHNPG